MRLIAHGALCVLALLLLLDGCAAARALQAKCTSRLTDLSCDLECLRRRARINEFGLRPRGDTIECFTLFAKGTQTYECGAGDGVWTARNPRADLFASPDRKGQKVASQAGDATGARVTWSSSEENASVTTVRAASNVRSSFPSPDNREKNLAWRSTVRSGGVTGTAFSRVVGVVMADTSGGVAPPPSECNEAGKTVAVPYEAAYVFYE